MLKVKILIDELYAPDCGLNEEQPLTIVLSGLDELYDNVFSTLTERLLNENVIVDDAKSLLISHECRLEKRGIFAISLLPTINLTYSNKPPK